MKGFFSQGLVVLTHTPVAIDELRALLPEFPFLRTTAPNEHWEFGGESAVISFRPEVNGCVVVDTVSHPWPDHMGDPKNEAMLFGAWSMGHFGPLAFPGGLSRAVQQAWSWREAKKEVPRHTSFIRLRLSYVLNAGGDAKVMPDDCDPRAELNFLTDIVRCVLRHPAAVCYFNPNGEVVAPTKAVDENVDFHREHNLPPLSLWSNVRLFNVTDDWLLMDSVGNGQLDTPDHELVYVKGTYNPSEIDSFIRNATLYVLNNGAVIKNGDTMDGPGKIRWQATAYECGIASPPREVICWVPVGLGGIPEQITDRKIATPPATEAPVAEQKRPWWKRWAGK